MYDDIKEEKALQFEDNIWFVQLAKQIYTKASEQIETDHWPPAR